MTPSFEAIRQAAAEILAFSVKEIFPDVLFVSGGATDIGFYYDFVLNQPLHHHAIPIVEEKMRTVIKRRLELKSREMMRENAVELFNHHGQAIQSNLVASSPSNVVPIVQIDDFYDFCHPPFVDHSNDVGAIKILDIKKLRTDIPRLGKHDVVRITGTAFRTNSELKRFLKKMDDADKRDHQKLGEELHLFFMIPEMSSTGCFWLPNGVIVRELLIDWWKKEHQTQGFSFVSSPYVKEYSPTPLSSPFHAEIFRQQQHSDQDLPIRYAETTVIHKHEAVISPTGLLNFPSFMTDLATIFCTSEQLDEELNLSLQFFLKTINIFGFECQWYLVAQKKWEKYIDPLVEALKRNEIKYFLDERESDLRGPMIEARIIDSLEREWPGPTLSIDHYHLKQLHLQSQGSGKANQKPVKITRSVFRSLERFVALLVEHYAGHFPIWLAPEQVRVLPVKEKYREFAENIRNQLLKAGLRAEIDHSVEKLGAKVHATLRKNVPYMIIIGNEEVNDGKIAVRSWKQGNKNRRITVEEFLKEVQSKSTKSGI